MSKTETVRKLLKEQDIKYTTDEDFCHEITRWQRDGCSCDFYEFDDGTTFVSAMLSDPTPEDAVGVTLCRTARRTRVDVDVCGHHECSSCGATVGRYDNFCKGCGSRLVGE